MRQHIDTVAWIHIGIGALGVLGAFAVSGIVGAAGLLSGDRIFRGAAARPGAPTPANPTPDMPQFNP